MIINGTLYVVNKTNQCSLSVMIFPVGWLHLSVKTVVMEIFAIWEAMILSSVFDGINERLEIGLSLLSSLESRVSFLIRGRTIYWLLKSEGKKPFSRGKFIIVVMVGRRTSIQFFRSHVRSFFFQKFLIVPSYYLIYLYLVL